jgi:hypothetical protein
MRKIILTLVAFCAAMTANATILRVSNVNGSSAPYSTIQAAHDAASAGDTIMVDGSNTRYGLTEVSKQLVFIGPGFWINENGLVQESAPMAIVEFLIHPGAAGTVIEGFTFKYEMTQLLTINANNCVVRRCYFWNHGGYTAITFSRDKVDGSYTGSNPTGAVIHQNFFADCGIIASFLQGEGLMTNVQITNNIFLKNEGTVYDINNFSDCYIAYNTMIGSGTWKPFRTVHASTIEHNIVKEAKAYYSNINIVDNNEWSDNIEVGYAEKPIEYQTDKDIRDLESIKEYSANYGAFAGDSPYVLSGIPAAPVIEDLVVPTTVEAGSKMNVTIKVGIQK